MVEAGERHPEQQRQPDDDGVDDPHVVPNVARPVAATRVGTLM
jgi:hypothetical protein